MNIGLLLDAAKFLDQQETHKEEERRSEGSELKSNEIVVRRTPDSHPEVTFSAPLVQVSPVNQLDQRAVSLTPVSISSHSYEKASQDERYCQRRRAHHPYNHLNTNLRSPTHVKSGIYSGSLPAHSSPKPLPVENSLGLLHAYKVADPPLIDLGLKSLSVEVTQSTRLSPETHSGTQIPPSSSPNGFARCGEDAKSYSPHSREFDDQYGSKEDQKKRLGNTPSREVHNKLEKNRRAHLKECFETLRRQLPSMEDKKISNQTILKAAHRYIQTLKRKEREYEHEMERLARQKIAHQQQLASLKKELQAKWDHIDFSTILPDMASLEQQKEKETKSTTTASEQPDFEDESHESTGHSNSLTFSSSPELKTPTYLTTSGGTYSDIYNSPSSRESFLDHNQPLNLSTSNVFDGQKSPMRQDMQKSPIRNPSPSISQNRNGEWPVRRSAHVTGSSYAVDDAAILKPLIGRVHAMQGPLSQITEIAPQSVGVNRTTISTYSTNATHISPLTIKCPTISHLPVVTSIPTTITHISQLVKSGTTVSNLPSMAKVITKFSSLSSLPHSGTTVTHIPHNNHIASNIGNVHSISTSLSPHHHNITNDSGIHTTNITHVPQLATIARVSASSNSTTVISGASHHHDHHALPVIGGNGISIPAHLVASGVHLSGTHGTILGQPAIQVITPEGYKILPADHGPNGIKPLAITLSHPGLDHLSSEDGKMGPVMVAVNKNGLSALHLAVPASARATISNQQGSTVPISSVPLNLTVTGASGATAVKVTQTGTATSIMPSYLPFTHANGITQLVQGMSLVGPIVVSQSQRGVMVSTNSSGNKSIKGPGSATSSGTTVPLVPAHYASTLSGGLVNSVVVVSAGTVMSHNSVATNTISSSKH